MNRRATFRSMAAACALLAAHTPPARAQDEKRPRSPNVFLERAYFSALSPTGKRLLFEGQPTVHYYFANTLGDQVWQKNGGWAYAFPVSAMLQVRMSREYSNPVKTPSYRIRPLYGQLFYLARPKDDPLAFHLGEVGLQFTHYSNGQRGCTYQGFTLQDTVCVVTDAPLAAQRLTNTDDGDFSTTYIALDAHYRRGKLPTVMVAGRETPGVGEPVAWDWTVGLEVQIHPLEIQPGGMNGDQARDWGQHQATLSVEAERRRRVPMLGVGVLRCAAEYTYRQPKTAGRRTDAGQVEVSFMPDRWGHQFGFFGRGHFGSDYYNINYQDRRGFAAFGVMWDLARLDKLNTALPD